MSDQDPYVFIGMPDKVHTVYPQCRCHLCCPYVKRDAYEGLLAENRQLRMAIDNIEDAWLNKRAMEIVEIISDARRAGQK